MNENTTKIENGLFLSCLCGKHEQTSTCEVYLRNTGAWEDLDITDENIDSLVQHLERTGLPSLAEALKLLNK